MVEKAKAVSHHPSSVPAKSTNAKNVEQVENIHTEAGKNNTYKPIQTEQELNFKKDLVSGKLQHKEGKTLFIFPYDNYVYTPSVDKKTGKRESLYEISQRYGLPKGYLKKDVPSGGGDFGSYEAPAEVVIDGQTLRKSVLEPEK